MKRYGLILIILAGFFLRFLYPMERYFDFDQEQIAVAAQKIVEGKPTLIGPLAGTIRFFTGPLIYYAAAFWYWLTQGHPWANTWLVVSIFLFNAMVLWLVLKRLLSRWAVIIFMGVYSLSAHIVILDRIAWDPNFSFLSGALVLIGLLFPAGKLTNFASFLGMWFAYQAHFSAFVMAAGVVLIGLYLKRWRFMIYSLSGLLVSLLPTLIFDLRHDWLNSRGLLALVTNPEKVSDDIFIFQRFWHLTLVSLENVTKIIIPTSPRWSLVGLGALILWFWLRSRSAIFNQIQRLILLAWVLVFPLTMMFYRGSIPEYYFLMQLPAFVFILTDLFLRIKSRLPLTIILSGFCLIALGVVIQQTQTLAAGSSLNNKLNALEYIKKNQADQPIDLVLDMEVKDRFGWNYLIDYLQLPRGENSTKIHIIYPVNPGAILTAKFGGIGMWLDRRGEVDAQAFVDDRHGILFYYPNDFWQLSEFELILYPQNPEISIHAFAPQNKAGAGAVNSGILFAYVPKNSAHKYFQVLDQKSKPGSLDRWQSVNFFQDQLVDRKTLTRERKEDLFIFSFPQDYTWKEVELFLSQVEGF